MSRCHLAYRLQTPNQRRRAGNQFNKLGSVQKSDGVAPIKQTMTAAYIPVFCQVCVQAQLQTLEPGKTPICPNCGAPSVVIPGETYAEQDIPLFLRIESAVRDLNISRVLAERVVKQLEDSRRRTREVQAMLLEVVDLLPNLGFLLPALHTKKVPAVRPQELPRAAGMLHTIASARLRVAAEPKAS